MFGYDNSQERVRGGDLSDIWGAELAGEERKVFMMTLATGWVVTQGNSGEKQVPFRTG